MAASVKTFQSMTLFSRRNRATNRLSKKIKQFRVLGKSHAQ